MQRRQQNNVSSSSTASVAYVPSPIAYPSALATTSTLLFWDGAGVSYTAALLEIPPREGIPTLIVSSKEKQSIEKTALPVLADQVQPIPYNGYVFGYTASPSPRIMFKQAAMSTNDATVTSLAQSTNNAQPMSTPVASMTATSDTLAASSSGAGDKLNGSSSTVSNGAAAGIAIGCLIAGALLAGLLLWFCWGKRRSVRGRDYEASSTALVPQEKGFATKATSLGSRNPGTSPMSDVLPLPLEDKAVSGEISKISSSIKNHVQSYYHADRMKSALLDLEDIQAIGHDLPISVGTISTLLGNTATREIALRFCIAWVVCSRILPEADSRTSLLPTEVAGASQKITNSHKGSSAHTSSVARWRVLTAELMQSSYVRDPFTSSDTRNHSIAEALDTLENILRPYADSRMDNGQRKRNLEEILKRSALFAFTLFSQPSTWSFDWREEQGIKPGELCVFPALVQMSDETGHRVSPPRPFSEAVVRRLDG